MVWEVLFKEAAAKYEKEHDVWYKAGKGYGHDRLEMSRNLKIMAATSLEKMNNDFPDIYKPAKLKGPESYLKDTRLKMIKMNKELNAPKNVEEKQDQRRKDRAAETV